MYWFLYDSNGNIKEAHQTSATQWTNLNGYAGALSIPEERTDLVTWAPTTPYSDGSTLSTGGYYYTSKVSAPQPTSVNATPANLSGNSQPTWPTTIGAMVSDGDLIWTCESADLSPVAQDAFVNKGHYTVTFTQETKTITNPDGTTSQQTISVPSLTKTVTSAQLLSEAKSAKLAQLQQQFGVSMYKGFTSQADGTVRTYAIDPTAMSKWTGTLAIINAGKAPTSIALKDFSGNPVNLTVAQFQSMAADGFTYFNNQESHLWNLETQVNDATTVDGVNAITW